MSAPRSPDPDAVMVMGVLLASPNRDQPGALLAAAKAYAALKSSREREQRARPTNTERSTTSMTSDITVNLSGTWSAKQRENNGLDLVAGYIRRQWKAGHQVPRVPVVGYIEYHNWHEPISGQVLVVSVPVIEPAFEADGSDPNGAGAQLMQILDDLRKQRGKGNVNEVPSRAGEMAGQMGFDFDGPGEEEGEEEAETRLGPDGPREVPPPSAEEELAERAEAKAAGVPAAEFSGGAA